MRPDYADWITKYVASQPQGFVRGKCREATNAMVKAFPELRRAAGFVYCSWGREQHFWCVTENGKIADPTRSQFAAVFEYEELDLKDPEARKRIPTGVCMDCGEDVYEGKTFCNKNCERSTMAYIYS